MSIMKSVKNKLPKQQPETAIDEKSRSFQSQGKSFQAQGKSLRLIRTQIEAQDAKYFYSQPKETLSSFVPNMNRILKKIGSKADHGNYQPNEEEYQNYKKTRYTQMKKTLSQRKSKIPFNFQLDQIVLDCYDYRIESGRTSIWRNYRHNMDQLSYRVHKIKKLYHHNHRKIN